MEIERQQIVEQIQKNWKFKETHTRYIEYYSEKEKQRERVEARQREEKNICVCHQMSKTFWQEKK